MARRTRGELRLTPDPATLFASRVLDGTIVAGPAVRAACRRHLADLERDDIYFDREAAERVVRFFRSELRLSDGQFEGLPFEPHISQQFKLCSVFGWKRRSDGRRRFRRVYDEGAKGSGKSPLAAGIGLYGLLSDGETGAEIYACATTKDQAGITFQDAVKMVDLNPRLERRILKTGRNPVKNLMARRDKGFFRPVAKTTGTGGSGPRPHVVLVDELHEHPSRDVMDTLERGFKWRRQPLIWITTNSGSDRKSVCWEERENAMAAAYGDRSRDDTFAYICDLDKGDDPLVDESCWVKVNPLLGVTVEADYLRNVVAQAKAIPGRRNRILRWHFCIWTDSETAWITRESWEGIEDPGMELADFDGARLKEGLDLSSRKDLSARALVFDDGDVEDPDVPGRMLPCYAAFVHCYTPEKGLEARAKRDRANYLEWVAGGFITATPGPVVRFPHIIADIEADQARFDLEAVAYDRHLIVRFEEDMAEMGADFPLMEHPQGWNRRQDNPLWMPGSIELLEELILQGRLRVQVNPVLRAAVAGAKFLESPAGLRRFDKAGVTQRIDPLLALVEAIGAWGAEHGDEDGESVYEQIARARVAAESAADGTSSGAVAQRVPSRELFVETEDDLDGASW